MIIERRKGLTQQPAGQILDETRVLQLRRHGLQGVRDPLPHLRSVRIGLGNRDVRVSIGHQSVPSHTSPSWRIFVLEHSTLSGRHTQRLHPDLGKIPGLFQKFRQTTQTHTIRIQKTKRFQQVENLRVRHTRTTPSSPHADGILWTSCTLSSPQSAKMTPN